MEDKNTEGIIEEACELQVNEALAENSENPEPAPESAPEEDTMSIADSVRSLSPTRLVLKRFFRSKLSVIGLSMIIFLFAFCWLGPLFSPYEENDRAHAQPGEYNVTVTPVTVSPDPDEGEDFEPYTIYIIRRTEATISTYAPPSAEHWLGTDSAGRDILTRIMYGGRVSLTLSLIVVFLEALIGIVLGGIAGYFGKWVDSVIMRIIDIFNCIPTLPLLLILGSILDGANVDPNIRIYFMMVFLTLLGWTGVARIVRGQILSLREQEFMVSATARGLTTTRKIFRHLVPNVIPQLIVSMTLGLGSVILMEASLSYMGLGVPLTQASWGGMINAVKTPIALTNYLFVWVPPGICIVLAVLGFNFIGDGLRDAFDPKAKR